MSEVLQVWLAISCRDTMREQKKVNLPLFALKELFHLYAELLNCRPRRFTVVFCSEMH